MSNTKKPACIDESGIILPSGPIHHLPAPPSPSYQYELYLGECIGDYVISYDFNPGGDPSDAIPCRITLVDLSNPPQTTGFCGSASYNSALQALAGQGVANTNGNGTITYTKTDRGDLEPITSIFLIIDSPLPGSKWSFTLSCPTVCDSDIDSDNQDEINCSQVIRLYGPTVIGCGEDFIGGGIRTLLDCSNVIRVFGPEGDSDYCLNCFSNPITLNISCGLDDSDSDNNNDSDSDINSIINILFDKTSWANIPTGAHNTQYKDYLDQAADRWAQFIRIDPNLINYINNNNLNLNEPNWNGIKLASQNSINAAYPPGNFPILIESNSTSTYAASCNPVSVVEMNRFDGDYAIIPLNFKLKINDYYADPSNSNALTSAEWVNAMTHELGHALGIGVFWKPANIGDPNPVWSVLSNPQNNFLDGNIDSTGSLRSFNVFENAQKAYNDIVGDPSLTKIPLETSDNPLSENGHWNDQFRSDNGVNYPGLADEIMVANVAANMTISRLSIKVLVDFKSFQEINTGAQEASPDTINSQSVSVSSSKVRCNCK